jgi:hypothetical protein
MGKGIPNVVIADPLMNAPRDSEVLNRRITPQGDLVSNMHGDMYEASRCGCLYYAAHQAEVAFSVGLEATTQTGLVLCNLAGNNKNLILRAAKFTSSADQAALSYVGLQGGAIGATFAHTTPLVWGTSMGSLNLGGTITCTAKADAAATTTTPKFLMGLGATALAAGDIPAQETQSLCVLEGAIIIQPGYWVGLWTLTALTGWGSLWWEEVIR